MVLPSPATLLSSALGLTEIRQALRLFQQPKSEGGFGLGLSRREVARQIGINESTLRGIEREGAKPRQATLDRAITRIRESNLLIDKGSDKRTRSDTFTLPGVSQQWYVPVVPENARAFKLVIRNPEGSPYPFSTLTAMSTDTFNVLDEIAVQNAKGFEVTRVIWDTGNGMRIIR